ncbi:unnamed protein product [Linum trigynum]|uniref:Uncharacterized protein n=1 Tax=Linum trigynum TaxID=586398 RepID=A0AAV2DUB3_9ROSI
MQRPSAVRPKRTKDRFEIHRRILSSPGKNKRRFTALSDEIELSGAVSMKRCRRGALKGWRFWLPPSSVLDGVISPTGSIPLKDEQQPEPVMGLKQTIRRSNCDRPLGEDGSVTPSIDRLNISTVNPDCCSGNVFRSILTPADVAHPSSVPDGVFSSTGSIPLKDEQQPEPVMGLKETIRSSNCDRPLGEDGPVPPSKDGLSVSTVNPDCCPAMFSDRY